MTNAIESTKDTKVSEEVKVNISEKEAIASLFALVEALSFEVCSSDVWWLAMSYARDIAVKKYGVEDSVFIAMMKKVESARHEKNKENPLSSMF